jgi:hypothetical protein
VSGPAAPPRPGPSPAGLRLAFALLLLVVFGSAIAYLDGLTAEPIKDEEQFWAQTRWFAERWPPDTGELQSYREPMPPIAFLLWAALERWHQLGLAAARGVSLVASLIALGLIASARPAGGARTAIPVLSALALLLYPYWVPLSVLVYTDVPAAAFVVVGFWLYLRERHLASALLFALAIGTRQYTVAFPLAIVVHEGLAALRARARPDPGRWPYLAATATLAGWFAFFGGPAPAPALERWPRHAIGLSNLEPSFALYFLAALGAYFVLLELVLDPRWRRRDLWLDERGALGVGVVALLFAIFPPEYRDELGPLNRTLVFVLGSSSVGAVIHLLLMVALASLTVLRFRRLDLAAVIVAVNAALMPMLWEPWEKYCMPVLASLWLLKSAGRLEPPVPSGAARSRGAPGLD